jgi:hypothetical protein
MKMRVIGFETVKELYIDDPDFKRCWNATGLQSSQDYYKHEEFLFKEKPYVFLSPHYEKQLFGKPVMEV